MSGRQVTGLLLALSLTLNLSVVVAWAYYGRGTSAAVQSAEEHPPLCETMREQLNLSASQWQAVEALRREFLEEAEPVQEQRVQANVALIEAALAPEPDPKRIALLLDETADLHRRFQALAVEHLRREAGVLTPEQRAQMLEFLTSHIRDGSCHRGLGLGLGMGASAPEERD